MGNSEVRAYAETPPGLSAEHTPSPFFPKIFCCAKYLREPFLLFSNGALVPSRSRSTDTPEGVPYFGCARAPPSASGGWASDFVLARRHHVGTRRPLQRDEQSSSLPLLRRSSRAVDAALGHGIARTMGNSEVRAYAETPPGLSAEHTPSPFFPQIFCCAKYLWEPCVFLPLGNGALVPSRPKNLRCANLFWEPYSFTCKANLVSPWAFAQGLYQLPFVLSQE